MSDFLSIDEATKRANPDAIYARIQKVMAECKAMGRKDLFDELNALQGDISWLDSKHEGNRRSLEWQIYRQLETGEMTKDGDEWIGYDDDEWMPTTSGRNRPAPDTSCPAHCHYRRHIANELIEALDDIYKLWDYRDGHLTTHYGSSVTPKMEAHRLTLNKAKKALDQ